jgi:hypothetical protein
MFFQSFFLIKQQISFKNSKIMKDNYKTPNRKKNPLKIVFALPFLIFLLSPSLTKAQENEYCSPTYSFGCNYDRIEDFVLNGENNTGIVDMETGCSEDAYDDRTDKSVDLAPGENYNIQITTLTAGDNVAIWIDFNDNGIFEESELVGTAIELVSEEPSDVSIHISGAVDAGSRRLRAMVGFVGDPTNPEEYAPCNDGASPRAYGETHDYTVNITQLDECTGTPSAGVPNENQLDVCEDWPFTIAVSEASEPAAGLERIWQSSLADQDQWTNIQGALSPTYIVVNGIDTPTDFRYSVTCTNSGESDFSGIIQVGLNEATDCYCISDFPNGVEPITLVDLKDDQENIVLYNESPNSDANPLVWEDFTDITSEVDKGETYTMTLEGNTEGNLIAKITVYIDWNQDGVFSTEEEDGEIYFLPDLIDSNGTDGKQSVGEIEIPESALSGLTRMRVTKRYSNIANPCNSAGWGQAEDYSLDLGELSVDNQIFQDFIFYPNPVKGQLTLKAGTSIQSVTVFNLHGQSVISVQPNTLETQLSTEDLQTGIYLMKVNLNGTLKSFKVVKE